MSVWLKMDAEKQSVVGKFIERAYYGRGELRSLIDLAPNRQGHPDDGRCHSLRLSGKAEDLLPWLELFEELTKTNLSEIKKELRDGREVITARVLHPSLFMN
ncbi:MAG: hypothetical protein M0R77_00270 [Gammaproteobacteria bacterium]|nr:hypothetical protein [Acholeplasmataceae bacterium]MCK9528989.1 hypothetical protein [Gammaproteobacteria bacterium]